MDQAAKLRQIVQKEEAKYEALNSNRTSKIIAVTSGKGGVGKTSLTVNMAAQLIKMGKRTLIIDADLGLANVQLLLGLRPNKTMKELMYNNKSIEEIIVKGPFGIDFISGGNGMAELSDLSDLERNSILYKLEKLDQLYDVIIIDTGAGISKNVISFLLLADEVVVISTNEPTALTDAYSIIKVFSEKSDSSEIGLVINRVKDIKEYKSAADTIITTSKQYLGLTINNLGFVYEDSNVKDAIFRKTPFVLQYPDSKTSKCVQYILNKMSFELEVEKRGGIMDKFKSWLKKTGR